MGRLLRRLIRYGPIIYPIVRRLWKNRKAKRNYN
ncbi:hypothetical protein J2Z64_001017 [Oceanobacillus polygoni]|uniref:Uncharacterized protein n=1 Tax=Oceanobacillus polygoni TaxID=1235259 RepID=A0A9X0YT31_9BACI|nr:hypothetical protein [Oceanobacillus polygoni]